MCKLCDSMTPASDRDAMPKCSHAAMMTDANAVSCMDCGTRIAVILKRNGNFCYGEGRYIAVGCAHQDCLEGAGRAEVPQDRVLTIDADDDGCEAQAAYVAGLGDFVRAMGSASAGKGLPA